MQTGNSRVRAIHTALWIVLGSLFFIAMSPLFRNGAEFFAAATKYMQAKTVAVTACKEKP